MSTKHMTIEIIGLSCGGGGSLAVERELARLPGVVRVYVNALTELAYVEYEDGRAIGDQLVMAVERAGFRAGETAAR